MRNPDSVPLLSVRGLSKTYPRRGPFAGRQFDVQALVDIDLDIDAGRTLGLIGPSGCGKSTLARCIAGLERPTAGSIRYGDDGLLEPAAAHRHVQMVFQDPGASLNPRFTVSFALSEPALVRARAHSKPFPVAESLKQVGLPTSITSRLTSQLSGGQKVRLALARALAALDGSGDTGILILDESLGSLDLSVRAQIINLLVDLQEDHRLAYILISHDPALAAHMADEIVEMAEGRIVNRPPHLESTAPRPNV